MHRLVCVREVRFAGAVALLSLLIALGSASAAELPEGVKRTELTVEGSGLKVWVYEPKGEHPAKLPCILIAPAGTRLFHGMRLAEDDAAEHIPWVQAGFAVVSYELSGHVDPKTDDDLAITKAVKAFIASEGGIKNAEAALKLASASHPFIDRTRVYVAGHSSAATIALTIAQKWPDLRGCVSFAPTVNLKAKLVDFVPECEKAGIPLGSYLTANSPTENMAKLKCPLLLFYARDDKPVVAALDAYAAALKQTKRPAEVKVVDTGGHYDSMIAEGIPAGIAWVKAREKL